MSNAGGFKRRTNDVPKYSIGETIKGAEVVNYYQRTEKDGSLQFVYRFKCHCGRLFYRCSNLVEKTEKLECRVCGGGNEGKAGPPRVDLTGKKFGKLTVLGRDKDATDKTRNCTLTKWLCRCECGNTVSVYTPNLTGGKSTQCKSCAAGKGTKRGNVKGHVYSVGDKVGRLTIVEELPSRRNKKGEVITKKWRCICDCGNEFITSSESLSSRKVPSCGCYRKERNKEGIERKKKGLKRKPLFDLTGEYGRCTLDNGIEFIFDKEDYEKIKDFSFRTRYDRYVDIYLKETKKAVGLHRFLMGVADSKIQVDHINCNSLDNRKENLRTCTAAQNNYNKRAKNKEGNCYPNVHYISRYKQWEAKITVNRETIKLGRFDTFEEAKSAKRAAEIKYWGEFAPEEIKNE